MFINDAFTYNGISSSTYNMYLIRNDNNYIQIPFGVKRTVITEKAINNPKPYFFGVNEEVLKFRVKIGFEGEWTDDIRKDVANWLFQDEYKPFISPDNTDIIYYCMPVGDASLYLTYLSQGYVELEFECNSPYAYSPVQEQIFDLSAIAVPTQITLSNNSNIAKYYYPEIEIVKIETGDVSLKNISNNNIEFKFTGLQNNETVYVDNDRKRIITSLIGVYRYSAFNKNWLMLVSGENTIEVTGKCRITVRSQFPIAL